MSEFEFHWVPHSFDLVPHWSKKKLHKLLWECVLVSIVMKLLLLVYCPRRWQAFSLNPFTYAYHLVNAKHIAGIRSDNIFILDVIQLQANRENYDRDFRISQKWRQHKICNLEYKLFYYQPQKIKACMWSKIALATKIKMFIV